MLKKSPSRFKKKAATAGRSRGTRPGAAPVRPDEARHYMGPPRPSRPAKPGARDGAAHGSEAIPRLLWTELRPMYDFWGAEIRRFYQLETLVNAVGKYVHERDTFILPSVHEVLGPAPLTSLTFELFQEGQFQLIFRLRAINVHRNVATFAFVVAKKEGDFSRVASNEHALLRVLHERCPEFVVRPYLGGAIFIPNRREPNRPRPIYAYLTQWLNSYHELGVNRSLQFFINAKQPHVFTIAQTEELKAQMIEIIARTFDPQRRDSMELPQIASGDFVVTKPRRGTPRLKLIACRGLLRGLTPAKLLHQIVDVRWDWGGRQLRLLPNDPALVLEGLSRARGPQQARAWLKEYRKAIESGKFPEQKGLSISKLSSLGIRPEPSQ